MRGESGDRGPWPNPDLVREQFSSATGKGIKVAIIDSGIDVSHPMLEGVCLSDDVAVSSDGLGLQVIGGDGTDVYGHGTAVASLLKKEAPDAEIGSFRALDASNRSRSLIISECVHQAISRGYQVINCSFGCRGLARYVMDYKEWVDQAYLTGVQVVAACSNVDSGIREWPAYFPSVISVRGIDCRSGDFYHRPGRMVSFLARGERVEVPWLEGSTKVETGSSYAAPIVSGKIARLLSICPDVDPALIKPLLANLAEPAPEQYRN